MLKDTVRFENFVYDITLYLDNTTKSLATATVELVLDFKSTLVLSPINNYDSYMQLYVVNSNVLVKNAESKLPVEVLFNQEGVNGYVQSSYRAA